MLDEFSQRAPSRRFEVNVVLVRNICLVEPVRMGTLLLVTGLEEPKKGSLELLREVVDGFVHVSNVVDTTSMRLGKGVLFERISIPALLLAGRAVPP